MSDDRCETGALSKKGNAMPHYVKFNYAGAGIVLHHQNGADYCPNKYAAEQKLLSSIHAWAGVDLTKAREQMELLTRFVREQ